MTFDEMYSIFLHNVSHTAQCKFIREPKLGVIFQFLINLEFAKTRRIINLLINEPIKI